MSNRTINTSKNVMVGLASYFLLMIFSFINRTIFINYLGVEYLVINGLFNDILQFLTLSELGVGTAVLFFMLYISNTAVSYFYSYKRSLLIADQRNFINVINHLVFTLLQYVLQIIVLICINNYTLYLVAQILCTLLSNLHISKIVNKEYKYLNEYKDLKLNATEAKELRGNIFSMLASKISSVIVTSTDSILISTFISTTFLGFYSNYTMLIFIIKSLVAKIAEGITGSLGNFVANKSMTKRNL